MHDFQVLFFSWIPPAIRAVCSPSLKLIWETSEPETTFQIQTKQWYMELSIPLRDRLNIYRSRRIFDSEAFSIQRVPTKRIPTEQPSKDQTQLPETKRTSKMKIQENDEKDALHS